jgi:hypothetical protein
MINHRVLSGISFFVVCALACPPAAFCQADAAAESLSVMRAAVEYVRPHLPAGPVALSPDYRIGVEAGGEITDHRPFPMPAAELTAALAAEIGARVLGSSETRWCEDETDLQDCTRGMLVLSQPYIEGDQARITVLMVADLGAYLHGFDLLAERTGGRWRVTKVLKETRTYT